jgi:hypothetical protein
MDDSVPGQLSARLLYLELLAPRAHRSAYFVVARRGKSASAPSSSARRARDFRRSQLMGYFLISNSAPSVRSRVGGPEQ